MDILRKVETLIRSEELEKLRDLPSAEIFRLGRLASLTEERVKKLGLKSDSPACSFTHEKRPVKMLQITFLLQGIFLYVTVPLSLYVSLMLGKEL